MLVDVCSNGSIPCYAHYRSDTKCLSREPGSYLFQSDPKAEKVEHALLDEVVGGMDMLATMSSEESVEKGCQDLVKKVKDFVKKLYTSFGHATLGGSPSHIVTRRR